MVEPREWLIRKDGYFYRPNCAGYTTSKFEAGRYTNAEAEREAAVEPWHMKAIHQDDVEDDPVSSRVRMDGETIASLKARISELERALAERAGGVKVKPLEWKPYRNGDADAVTPFGEVYTAYMGGAWRITRNGKAGKFVTAGDSIETAKAAAQADYERRIRSALTSHGIHLMTDADLAARDDDALERAAAIVEGHTISYGNMNTLRPRLDGDRNGFEYADAIRTLKGGRP